MHIEKKDAMDETAQLTRSLVDRYQLRPQARASGPSPELMNAVHDLAMDEESLTRGEFLSRVLRMPLAWQNVLLEYINRQPPYNEKRFTAWITVRNIHNTQSVTIVKSVRQQPLQNPDGSASDNWENIPNYYDIPPGETVRLPSDRAVHALWKHGRYCVDPAKWDANPKARNNKCLEEVGYQADFEDEQSGESISVDSFKFQEQLGEDALIKAKALDKAGETKEALACLGNLPEHIKRPRGYNAFATRLADKLKKPTP